MISFRTPHVPREGKPHAERGECVPLPLLITGITGVQGYHALRYFQGKYPGQVFGVRRVDDGRMRGPQILECNLEDADGLARLFGGHRFASVLDCEGNCALKSCELNPEMARRINVDGVQNLVRQSARGGARMVHLSVDLVFAGRDEGGYTEDDRPDPVTVYGKTMVKGEGAVLEADDAACILRISLPMGTSLNGHAGAIDWINSRMKKASPATLYVDEVRTPTYVDCMNRLYEAMLGKSLSGIYHAGGPRGLSLYQIGQIINRVGGYDPDCLFGIPRAYAAPVPPRAGNVCMNSAKLIAAIGRDPFDPWPLDAALVPTHDAWHRERPKDERSSPLRVRELLAANPATRPQPLLQG